MSAKHEDEQRIMVRERYGKIAGGSCGCPPAATMSCCCSSGAIMDSVNLVMGYTQEQLDAVIEGANLKELVSGWFPGSGAENVVASADIKAMKPLLSFDLALPGDGADGANDG